MDENGLKNQVLEITRYYIEDQNQVVNPLLCFFFGQWQCVKVWCWTNPTRKGLLTVDCWDESAVSGDSSVDRGRSQHREQLQPALVCLIYTIWVMDTHQHRSSRPVNTSPASIHA